MSEKDFDNQIRKKLDSVQSDYSPDAWDSFKKLLPVPWYITFFKTYGGWIFGGISSLALLINLLQTREFDKTYTINDEKSQVEIVKQIETIVKTDTIVKYIYVSPQRVESQGVFAGNVSESDKAVILEKSGLLVETSVDSASISKAKSDLAVAEVNKEDDVLKEMKKPKRDSTGVPAENIATRPHLKKNTFWDNLAIRPGIEVDYGGGNSFSFGPLVEIFLKNRFSISTGISISNTSPRSFPKIKEFNKETGKDFEGEYKPVPPPQGGGIKDITIETSRIRMPVYMSYYIPLNYNLNFLISTGTRLDLKVSENVSYTNDGFGETPFRRFESSYRPKVFNNLYYGMGIQYNYGRIYGQLTPYFEFPFSKPNYLIPANKFGLNATLKFSLK